MIAMGGGAIIAQWAFHQSNQATVEVKGSSIALYSDSACTQQIVNGASLGSFGVVNVDNETPISSTVTIYAKNIGLTTLSPTIAESSLATGLTLHMATVGPIGTTPVSFATVDGFKPTAGISAAMGPTGIPVGYTGGIQIATIVGTIPTSGLIKIDSELFTYTGYTVGPPPTLTGLVGGQHGTTPAAHAASTAIAFGTWGPMGGMAPGAVIPIALDLTAPTGTVSLISSTPYSFNVIIDCVAGS
jgi:uncharacterized membrane protein (DUF441 family)